MEKDYRQKLFDDIYLSLSSIALGSILYIYAKRKNKLSRWVVIPLVIGFVGNIVAIAIRVVLFRVGKNPEIYRQFMGLPIVRLQEKRTSMGGGRPRGSLKDGESIYDDDVLALLVEAQKRLDDKGYKGLAAYCKQKGKKLSTVRGCLKRYKEEIALASK